MTTSDLTWTKVKDAIVVSIGALLVGALGFLLKGQAESNATLSEVKRDLAVMATESRRDREEVVDLKLRVRAIEETMPRLAQMRGK